MSMKNIIYSVLCVAGLFAVTSCNDFLDTDSPSVVDGNLVFSNIETARAAMDGAYEAWRDCAQNAIFGDGLYYAADVTGSDIERHPEPFSNQPGRHYPETLYQNGSYISSYGLLSYMKETGDYAKLYSTVARANAIINAMKGADYFESIISAGTPSELSQLYGEAIALRATCYRELIRNFGDVPYQVKSGVKASGLTSRDSIYDCCLAELQQVEPLMYRVGEVASVPKNFFSRTYVQGLIGRMALEAGGYQTRRGDLGTDFYKDGKGNILTFEVKGTPNNNSTYGRRSDWKSYYDLAKTYYKACIDNSGSAKFHTTDPRSGGKNGQVFDNPYQYFFQQMNDLTFADESVYEYAMTQGTGNDARPYSFGRVSSGGGSNDYPCKAYGQGRINPAFYYGMFDPQDKRRDVSVCVTGSAGKGVEKLLAFAPNSKAEGGGLTLNKWDENRMASPYVAKQRTSGINGPYMRLAEVYLGYAEACAATGDDATAKSYLKMIRQRSFPSGQDNTDAFISSCGTVLKAVIEERGFEYAGEGDRRWTLIRSGFLPEAIKNIKEMTAAMMSGLKADGYYTFANGNVIPSYVWTKLVDARTAYGYRLTTQCPTGKENDPVLYPGWRGQHDSWEDFGLKYGSTTPKTNLAIKGLFEVTLPDKLIVKYTKVIPAGSPEGTKAEEETVTITSGITFDKITDLLNIDKKIYSNVKIADEDGYEVNPWGVDLVKYYDEYYTYLFYDYDYTKAPIYLWPFTPNVISTGGFTNGYGFKQV